MTPERRAFLKRREETRKTMMRENGRKPSQKALADRMKQDAQAAHKKRMESV